MSLTINASTRDDQGKGASRRLRRSEQVPAIIYGAGKSPSMVSLNIHEITHFLDNEEAFTSVVDLHIDKQKEPVIVKDLQRHPAKNIITHVDFLRVNMQQTIVTQIPLHFIGEDDNAEIRLGAVLNQFITAVEVSCLPADLPHGIEIDIRNLKLGEHINLTGLDVPKGVTLTALTHGDIEAHDQSVVAVQAARKIIEEEEDAVEVPEDENVEGEDDSEQEG